MSGFGKQMAIGLLVSLGNFISNFSLTWPSYALQHLQGDQSPIGVVSKKDASLIGSVPMLGAVVATLVAGWLSDRLGRRKTTILVALCFILSLSMQTCAKNVTILLVSRYVIGIGFGIMIVLGIPLVSEICSPELRGSGIGLIILMYNIGGLVSYICGWVMSYEVVNYFALSFCVAFAVLLILFLKETPAYLLMVGDEKEAVKSLMYYRSASAVTPDILDELQSMKNPDTSVADVECMKLNHESEKLNKEDTKQTDMSAWKTLLISKPTQRALVITTTNAILLVMGGTMAVQVYAGSLFKMAAPGMSPDLCAIILSIVCSVGSLVSTFVNNFVPRRKMMMTSALLSSLFLAKIASLLHWSWGPQWLIPLDVLAFSFVFQIGVAIIPLVQISEAFLPKVRNLVSTIVVLSVTISNFILLAAFPPAVDRFGLDGTFLCFSGVCALQAIVTFFTMRDSKGKPLEEIMAMFSKGFFVTR